MTSGDIANQVVVRLGQLGELPQCQAGSIAGVIGIDQAVARTHAIARPIPHHRAEGFGVPRGIRPAVDLLRHPRSICSTKATCRALSSSMSRLAGRDVPAGSLGGPAGILGMPLPLVVGCQVVRCVQDDVLSRMIPAGGVAERLDDRS